MRLGAAAGTEDAMKKTLSNAQAALRKKTGSDD